MSNDETAAAIRAGVGADVGVGLPMPMTDIEIADHEWVIYNGGHELEAWNDLRLIASVRVVQTELARVRQVAIAALEEAKIELPVISDNPVPRQIRIAFDQHNAGIDGRIAEIKGVE